MTAYGYRIERRSSATAERLYDVLWDVPGWRTWAPLVKVSRWQEGSEPGVGAVREVGQAGAIAKERITRHEPPHIHEYVIDATRPARNYRSLVEFTEEGNGTRIVWTGQFEPGLPGVGRPYQAFLNWYIGKLADKLVAKAEMG